MIYANEFRDIPCSLHSQKRQNRSTPVQKVDANVPLFPLQWSFDEMLRRLNSLNIWNIEAVQFNRKKKPFINNKKTAKSVNSSMPNGRWPKAIHSIQISVKRKTVQLLGNIKVQKAIYIKMSTQNTPNIFDERKMLPRLQSSLVCFMLNFRHLFWLIFLFFDFSHFSLAIALRTENYCSHAQNLSSSTTWCSSGIPFLSLIFNLQE